jgi:hypothetical protein
LKPALKKTSDFLASYKLSSALFLLLLLLTYLGTMQQVEHGLYQSQQKYFESMFLVHWAFDTVPIPLPGGYLAMIVLFINLLWGVVARFRFRWSQVGILVAHTGIMVLLVGSLVSYWYSVSGHMALYENQRSSEFESSYEWEIGVGEAAASGPVTEYVLHQEDFDTLSGGRSRTFTFSGLPFDLKLEGYAPNAAPMGGGAADPHAAPGKQFVSLPLDREQERNLALIYASILDKQSGAGQSTPVWAGSVSPTTVEFGGKRWNLTLRKRLWQLPFSIRLDKFTRVLHPRTNTPREFSSLVTKTEDGSSQQVKITMNEPLRHLGYTFYQSSWGSSGGGQNERLYSVFSVVKNPADQAPLYSCVITTIGLIVHFVQKLVAYLRKEKAKRT